MSKLNTAIGYRGMQLLQYLPRTLALFSMLFSHFLILAQTNTTIKGTVVTEKQEPVSGAVVTIKGSSKGTFTNHVGAFTLLVTDMDLLESTLEVTHIGFAGFRQKIGSKREFTITLIATGISENEVIVNSYTKPKRREEVVGSISTVTARQLQADRPFESFDKMLEGLVPGLQVVTNTELGSPVRINIRGQNTLTSLSDNVAQLSPSAQPLFIIDGVPITEAMKRDEPQFFLGAENLLNPLSNINPDDIETISVLKDAAAVSIYGSNASNGVIIITTKKGKSGKTRFTVGYNSGISKSINRVKWLNGEQYYNLVKETYINDGRSPFDAELLAGSPNINTNWFELLNQYASYNNIDADLSGGNDKTTFRFATSYLNQQSIQKNNDFKKLYFRLRVDHAINEKLNVGLSMAPTLTKRNALNAYNDVPIVPNVPVYNADGSFFKFSTLGVANPLAVLEQNKNEQEGGALNGNISLSYKILKNLSFNTIAGIDASVTKQYEYESPLNATGATQGGFVRNIDRQEFAWISTSNVSWSPKIKNHSAEIIAGFEAKEENYKLLGGSASRFSYQGNIELGQGGLRSSSSSRQATSAASTYFQTNYNFKGKYFTLLSGRYDQSSIFGSDINATFNGAIGLGWIISKEKFLEPATWLNLFRVRLSYGTTGNSRIGSYQAKGLYSFNPPLYDGFTAAWPSSAPNENLTWEKQYKKNLGIDISVFKRLDVTLDFYENITDDAIASGVSFRENGFSTVLANIGKMKNSGFDGSIRANIFNNKFVWNATVNFGYNKNVILSLANDANRFGSNESGTTLQTGRSTTAIWGFRFAGVNPETGREQYYDKNGNIVSVLEMDRNIATAGYYIGDRLPKLQGGIINNFSYKGVNLTINFIYNYGSKILIDYTKENNGRNLSNRNQSVNLLDRWQKPGDITNIPKLSSITNPLVYSSTKYMYDNSFLKLSNISISYTLPNQLTKKYYVDRLTIFGNGTNLVYWNKQKSPKDRNGIAEYRYKFPEAQTFNWGIKIGF